ncbi:hypothetical protein CkaCkLH20_07985 [Colletotrichum karsti]|uniref:Extracellular membrane protein CFEM domain-containing protein n=1 Tax=Colletotrichum karsti TaxID=1095194 RepID=A0A9P6HZX0_9PEZI|nr:uncharacterized protein CkaCkLH20_07985 [Colletotrichum karsti]KAF9874422.1 hypothetical protein CkaCkLH20_07985 [Colletotrichum karsti]
MLLLKNPEKATSLPMTGIGLVLLNHLVSAAAITTGALGRVSIHSERPYTTARACAAGCLIYNGNYHCGVGGYHDLGIAMQCGCEPMNGCYCNTGLWSYATSYISSCVSSGCSQSDNWSADLTSMVNFYDSYCATANGAIFNAPNDPGTPVTQTSEGVPFIPTRDATVSSESRATQTSGSVSSSSSSTDAPNNSKKADGDGLTKGEIAGLVVGIASAIITGFGVCFQIRKKRRRAVGSNTSPTTQGTALSTLQHDAART